MKFSHFLRFARLLSGERKIRKWTISLSYSLGLEVLINRFIRKIVQLKNEIFDGFET